jgi:hypothetical protein
MSQYVLRLVSEAADLRAFADRHFRTVVQNAHAARASVESIADAAGLSPSRIQALLGEPEVDERARSATVIGLVVIVAAGRVALEDYDRHAAYICQADRSFRGDVVRLGFYSNKQVHPAIARIQERRVGVEFTRGHLAELRASGVEADRRVAAIIEEVLADPHHARRRSDTTFPRFDVFLLSAKDDPETLLLPQPILHSTSGPGTAWVQKQRYVSEESLRRGPRTTDDIR